MGAFVGRQHELRKLVAALSEPRAIVAVEGDAGIGKTRLLQEALAVAHPRVMIGRCLPMQDPLPLAPLVAALRSAGAPLREAVGRVDSAGLLRHVLPDIAPSMPPAPAPLFDARAEQLRMYLAFVDVLAALAPAVLVLEDVHWADRSTLELVAVLADALPSHMVLVVSYRRPLPDWAPPMPPRGPADVVAVRLQLDALTIDEVAELIRSTLDTSEVSDEFVRHVHGRTAGNPLAVTEGLRLLVENEALIEEHGAWRRLPVEELWIPTTIRESVLERVDVLGPDARRLIEVLAVAGTSLPEATLAEVTGLDERATAEAVRVGLRAGLVREEPRGRYELTHSLAAQAVYDAVPHSLRRELHSRLADRVEDGDLARLVHHLRIAERTEEWAEGAIHAAKEFALRGDDVGAARLLKDVTLDDSLPRETRGSAALAFASTSLRLGTAVEAIPSIVRALEQGVSTDTEAPLRATLAALERENGDATAAWSHMHDALPGLVGGYRGSALLTLARPWVVEGTRDQHLRYLEEGVAFARRADDEHFRAWAADDEIVVRMYCGSDEPWPSVELPAADSGNVIRGRTHLQVLSNLAHAALAVGDHVAARAYVERAESSDIEPEGSRGGWYAQTARTLLDFAVGRWRDALTGARALVEQSSIRSLAAEGRAVLTMLSARQAPVDGHPETALRAVYDQLLMSGLLPTAMRVAVVQAAVLQDRAEDDAARAIVEHALGILRAKDMLHWANGVPSALCDLLLSQKDLPAADALVREVDAGVEGRRAPAVRAHLQYCRGALAAAKGSGAEAAEMLRAAAAAFAGLPDPHAQAMSMERLGEVLFVVDPDDSVAAIRTSIRLLDSVGAAADLARLRRRLRARGITVLGGWPRGGRSGGELSDREAEIVGLIRQGLTNREIAARLVLSVRTVEGYVEQIRRKLLLGSRREIARSPDVPAPPR